MEKRYYCFCEIGALEGGKGGLSEVRGDGVLLVEEEVNSSG